MAKVGELAVEVKLDVSEETVKDCITILNMYLKNSSMEAFVETDKNGDTQIHLEKRK